ncbi:MAG: glycosyltransferase family 4 protein [Candidatus Binatia bacterium]
MEILVITWNYPPRQGGMEQLLASVCAGLSKDHRVSVITAYADKHFTAGEESVFRPASPGLVRYFLFAFTKGFALLCGNRNISVVFGGSVLVTPIVLILARLFRRKAIVQAHGLDLIYRNSIYQFFVVRGIRYVDRVIANSRHTASLAQQKGVTERVIEIIHPGVDWQRFQVAEDAVALKQTWGLAHRKVILFVGRLARRKGVTEFIEHSLADIVTQVPEVCFVIAGANAAESLTQHEDVAGEIRRAIERHDLSEQLRWLGAVSDAELAQIYALCDVLVLPVLDLDSDVEGFGMVALEAAAAGKPVIATRCGGIPDAVKHGASGILVEPGDYQRLSESIVSLLRDPQIGAAMGQSGRQRTEKEFTWGSVVSRYEATFRGLSEEVNQDALPIFDL